MSNVLEPLVSEFLAARALSVNRRTYERDLRVTKELFAAIREVGEAGGGLTILASRGGRETVAAWDGPMSNLEVDLICTAVTAMARRPRDAEGANTARDVGFTLRQLGRWLSRGKLAGMNVMRLGFLLDDYPFRFTCGPYEQPARPPSGRPRLHLVREERDSAGGAAVAGG